MCEALNGTAHAGDAAVHAMVGVIACEARKLLLVMDTHEDAACWPL